MQNEDTNKRVPKEDREYLRKAEEELPDSNKSVENTDALLGDVDPNKSGQQSQGEHSEDEEDTRKSGHRSD